MLTTELLQTREHAQPAVADVDALIERLSYDEGPSTDHERIELIAALERLKGAAAAAQARVTVAFDASQRARQSARGLPASEQGRGIASQVALARRDSPVRGGRHLGLARALVAEMPHTLRELTAGRISEWRATVLVRETAVLSAEHRERVDAELADRLARLGDRGVEREARKLAYRLDPGAVMKRVRGAEADRRVSIRPAPDTMSLVTGFVPVAQGVAVHAALTAHADSLRAGGDPRSRGQIMADTFVERLTGQPSAAAVPVEVQLVMTDRALLTDDDTPARLVGHGPLPAALARMLVRDTTGGAWLRRLFTAPGTGEPPGARLAAPHVPGRAPHLPRRPRRGLPHALVRRADPARRPRGPRRGRRVDQRGQRAGAVRELQPGQGGTWVERRGEPGGARHDHGVDPHRARLHQHGARPTRPPTTGAVDRPGASVRRAGQRRVSQGSRARTISSSTPRGSEPESSTAEWNFLMSKSAPCRCSASARIRWISTRPTM